MKTKVIRMNPQELDMEGIREAGEILRQGGLVAFPTETVYGLGGNGLDPRASAKIYRAKGRPSDNPLIIHIADMEDLEKIVKEVPESAKKLASVYWPGPLTMIFQKSDIVPYETTGGMDTVAVRMPVDFTEEIPTILRPGYINQEMVRRVIGQVQMDRGLIQADSKVKPKAPGMKYRHYAPKADLTVVEGSPKAVQEKICALVEEKIRAGEKVGVIATEESIKAYPEGIVKCIGTRADEESIARHLFAVLREFDDCGVTYIYSEAFDTPQMGQAIMNRLMKAAGQKKIQV